MYTPFKKLLAVILTSSMLLSGSIPGGLFSASAESPNENGESVVHFSTSFEENENEGLLISKEDGTASRGVIHTEYGMQSPGLQVNISTISGSSDYVASESKYNLFDGKPRTKFITGAGKGYVQFALTKAATVAVYSVSSANDEPTRDPKNWTLYGSADGKSWVELDTREGVIYTERYEIKSFAVDKQNQGEYLWYKLDVTSNQGGSLLQFSGLDLYAKDAENIPEGEAPQQPTGITYGKVDLSSVKATQYNDADQVPTNLFDGSTGTKYLTMNGSCYVEFALTSPMVINFYSITSANDHHPRDPKEWNFYGSVDGSEWTLLDHQEDQSFANFFQTKSYPVDDTTAYQYFKLDVLSNHGKDAVGFNIVQMSELAVGFDVNAESGEDEPVPTYATVDPSTVTFTPSDSGKEGPFLFDGDLTTRYLTRNAACFVQFALTEPAVINYYEITTGKDQPARDPKNWTLSGSDDGESWTVIHDLSEEDQTFTERTQTYSYEFKNSTAYKWYRWDITSNHGVDTAGLTIVQVGELTLGYKAGTEGEEEDTDAVATVDTATVTSTPSDSGKEAIYLFDGNIDSRYLTRNAACFVQFALTEPMVVNYYDIVSGKDQPARDPKDWTFYGSEDGEHWNELDTKTGIDFAERKQTLHFEFNNATPYLWYKWDIADNHGTDTAGLVIVQVGELTLGHKAGLVFEEEDKDAVATVDVSTVTGTPGGGAGKELVQLFDGDADARYLTTNTACYVQFAITEPMVVNYYDVTSAKDTPTRDPRDWDFYGSNDGTTWNLLDHRTGQSFDARKQVYHYEFNNDTAYLYYKWDITANNGESRIQVAELGLGHIAGLVVEEVITDTPATVDISTVTATTPDGSSTPDKLFDGNTGSKYLTRNPACDVVFSLTESSVVNYYTITSANDHDPRDPKDWNLYGSADGSAWTLLDSRMNEDFAERYQTNRYSFFNESAYLWYKLEVTSNNGKDAVGLDIVQISELSLGFTDEKIDPPEVEEIVLDKTTIQGTTELSAGEGKTKLFDGSEDTKLVVRGNGFWVSFALEKAATVRAYSLTSADDWAARDPKSWTLYGSENGTSWITLDTQSGITFGERHETRIFRIANNTPYLYYKLEVTERAGTNDYTQLAEFTLLNGADLPKEIPGMESRADFGPLNAECNTPGAWTGTSCLAVYGEQSEKTSFARNVLFKDLSIPVDANTRLSYVIFPGLFDLNSYDYEYTSCRVIIDLHFTDGTYLSELGAVDQYGSKMTPAGQVEGECLVTAQWNHVESCIGAVAAGKTIDRICVLFEMEDAEDASRFLTFFDDLKIESKPETVYEHLSDYINILRGTNNDSAFSRGLCTPGVTLPQGFNFISPVNNPAKSTACYNYQLNGSNHPMDSITVTHAPNYWIGSYGSWQFMANTTVNAANDPAAADISSEARQSSFTHLNETANAHYYAVTFNEGTPASGVKVEVTPTSHAAVVRFTFPENSANASVIFDSLWGTGTLTFGEDGKSFAATTEHNSAGSSTMYVVGSFDTAYTAASVVGTKQGIVTFAPGTTTVTMTFATSFISVEQAAHSLALEIGDAGFDEVFAAAQGEWDALCGKFEIEGASYYELLSFYSNLYRMYAFPNLLSENEGTNESPFWVYKSPYTKQKTAGILYTNNGFWDTYRTTWAGYSLFTADKDGELLNGIAQHYVDSGWLPRWLGPGAVNCMVGTSSDIIFADAYIKGIDFNYDAAWASMVKNASAYASDMTAGGRVQSNTAPYRGYVTNEAQEGCSSSLSGYMDDYGLYCMAKAMGLEDEAEYYLNRCLKYSMLYSSEIGFFLGRSSTGAFSATKNSYDPAHWNGPKYDYTESVGWVNAFPATYDGNGLAILYGGREALAAKLDELFDDSIASMKKVVNATGHELREFKEVKMGQYEHNNQPAHHLIYTYAFSSEPYKIQEYTREVLRHVYVGSELGQGYPGDEDNGEMSAWYIFNALGFYPYAMASGEYVIGSPLFDKVTVHLDNGNDIVIIANNNSAENVYIQSATLNGEAFDRLYITHEELTSGCTLVYEMGNTPSAFGSSEEARPSSISTMDALAESKTDLTDGLTVASDIPTVDGAVGIGSDISGVNKLFDNNSLTETTVANGAQIVYGGKLPSAVSILTLTSGANRANAPTGFTLEVSNDGTHWYEIAAESDISFTFDRFLTPFLIPEETAGVYRLYRLTLLGGGNLSEIELLGLAELEENLTDLGDSVNFDLNDDGCVSIADVTTLLTVLAGDEENEKYDLNGDGCISIKDVTVLLTFLAGNDEPTVLPEAYRSLDPYLSCNPAFEDPQSAGMAGKITVSARRSASCGEYNLCYGDEAGVLAGYAPIATVNIGMTGFSYTAFNGTALISPPSGATTVVLCDENSVIRAYAEIPAAKQLNPTEKVTTFAAISDVHVFNSEVYGGAYDTFNGDEDLVRAVGCINEADVDFTAITGDLIISFSSTPSVIEAELTKSTNILKTADAPVYVVKGNHDKMVDETLWKTLTGCDTDYYFTVDDDYYVFLSLLTVQNVGSNDDTPYGAEKLAWLQGVLEEAAGKRVFLFMHYPFAGLSGLRPGERYGFTDASTEEEAILGMIENHGAVTVFNGHTHYDFQSTSVYPNINVCRIGSGNNYSVHLPSVAYPRDASYNTVTEESQGYIVEVYADGILLKGLDFTTGDYMPTATWFLPTAD